MAIKCRHSSFFIITLTLQILNLFFSKSSVVAYDTFPPGQVAFVPPLEPWECPFPCLPPPIAATPYFNPPPISATPYFNPPPSSPSCPPPPSPSLPQLPPPSVAYYPPPLPVWSSPLPPEGYFPFYPPPDSVNNFGAPPPPDPILPYFPFYYMTPPPSDFSSAVGRDSHLACRVILIAILSNIFTHYCTLGEIGIRN